MADERPRRIWVSNHWDINLEGLCVYRGAVHHFKLEDDNLGIWSEEADDYIGGGAPIYAVRRLPFVNRARWLFTKWRFEAFVGRHWSLKDGRRSYFYYRRPQWLFRLLFKLHYALPRYTKAPTTAPIYRGELV